MQSEYKANNRTDETHKTYKTHNVYLAAFLLLKGHQLTGITHPQGYASWWLCEFRGDERLGQCIQQYFAAGVIPARKFAQIVAQLKTAISKTKRGEIVNVQSIGSAA